MIPFDLTMGFVVGLLIAYSAKKQLKNEQNLFSNKYLFLSALWMAIFYAPSTMWFQFEWPFWNTMYFLPPESLPGYLIWFEAMFLIIAILLGFLLAQMLIKRNKDNYPIIIAIVVSVLLIIFLLILQDRSFYVGTYSEWSTSNAEFLLDSPLFYAALIAGSVDLIPLFYILYYCYTEGKQSINT
ncbi:MAG: hypothetical protein HeimC3_32340 [Candidatus Heimdallarchaeota archaeon LC_3]|nr:MAG: hypothetical protein HeimC3_32340 [Candidatus Heimdallarchaeota archaeon LC_3]